MVIGTLQRLNQLDSSPGSTPYAIVIDGQEMRRVKIVKYLGMMVDDKLVWDQHVDYISSKITRNIGILKRMRHFIPQESLLLLYYTLILDTAVLSGDNVVRLRRINSRLYKTRLPEQ